ncbi:ABC transporter ATP-binding protein [Microbacterium atlanticum]|uniref:ABC transporter ATP-binding protein n=1 Tax=Microbacterium atlanticum TaxID=2782168 RepID=UPI00188854FC|nr:ATP-binding cassette domain-containing protein [Microbacterium atlanticum]
MLRASDVTKSYAARHGRGSVIAVDHATVEVAPGQFVAVVGESGSGKSTLSRILLGLIRADSGTVTLGGESLRDIHRRDRLEFSRTVQCVLQDPSGSLNPRKTIRRTLTDVIRLHRVAQGREAIDAKIEEVLSLVRLPTDAGFIDRLPNQLSGGQRQRVLIARALVVGPQLIVADEAVSALDAVVKAGVLEVMDEMRERLGVGYLFITHDLPVVKKVATYVYVMKSGVIVEEGPTAEIFENPQNDYTRMLLAASPDLDQALARFHASPVTAPTG